MIRCKSVITKGFSTVEAVLAVAVFIMVVSTMVGAYLYGEEATSISGERNKAIYLAEEGLEAVRSIRDETFTNLIDGSYGLAVSSNQWAFSGTSDNTGSFLRNTTISTVDADTKKVDVNVTWQQNAQRTGSVTLSTYLTNWIRTVNANWVLPVETSTMAINNSQNLYKIKVIGNYAYIIANAGTPNFLVVDISNLSSPTLVGSVTIPGTPSDFAISGNYAYVVSNSNAMEVEVVNITNPAAPTFLTSYNASGKSNGMAVASIGSNLFVARAYSSKNSDREFLILDVSDLNNITETGSLNLPDTAYDIVASGNYAYIASQSNSQELEVINISNLSNPTLAGSLNLSGNVDPIVITISGNNLALGRSGGELDLINVSTPTSPSLLGTYDSGNDIYDMYWDSINNFLFDVTASNTAEFQILNVSNPSAVTLVGSYDYGGNLYGIDYIPSSDRVITVGNTKNQEFAVFAPY